MKFNMMIFIHSFCKGAWMVPPFFLFMHLRKVS